MIEFYKNYNIHNSVLSKLYIKKYEEIKAKLHQRNKKWVKDFIYFWNIDFNNNALYGIGPEVPIYLEKIEPTYEGEGENTTTYLEKDFMIRAAYMDFVLEYLGYKIDYDICYAELICNIEAGDLYKVANHIKIFLLSKQY